MQKKEEQSAAVIEAQDNKWRNEMTEMSQNCEKMSTLSSYSCFLNILSFFYSFVLFLVNWKRLVFTDLLVLDFANQTEAEHQVKIQQLENDIGNLIKIYSIDIFFLAYFFNHVIRHFKSRLREHEK